MFIVYKPLRMKNVEVSNGQSRGNQETRTKQLPKIQALSEDRIYPQAFYKNKMFLRRNKK